jgi:hypothetical protein
MAKTKGSPKTAAEPACPEDLNLPRQTREDHVASVVAQIEAFDERLGELESDMESSGWDDIGDFRGQLDDLRSKLRALRSRAEELDAIPDTAWPGASGDMDEAMLEAAGMLEEFEAGLKMVLPE